MVFVFDLDDTVCDTDGASEKYILDFIKEHNLPYKQIASVVRFAEQKFDWSHEEALAWYKQYGDEMFLHFPCKEKAVETINKLYDMGHTIVIATARANDWHTEPIKYTNMWLEKCGLKFHKIYIGRIDKEKICEEVEADFFVDDDIKTTQRVADYFKGKTGKQAFLMTSAYNRELAVGEGIKRVDSFKDFGSALKKHSIYIETPREK